MITNTSNAVISKTVGQIVADEIAVLQLASAAGFTNGPEGGWGRRGDRWHVIALDYVPPDAATLAPYLAPPGAGLGLVRVERKRVYARSAGWRPGWTASVYLVGRNENRTAFAHAVPRTVETVHQAIRWMWRGQEGSILARQGDIALAWGPGPKFPAGGLPNRHDLDVPSARIVHPEHPAIPIPMPGQRVITARRARPRVAPDTRD